MPPLRASERALELLLPHARQQYICRTCRAQAYRQFHSTRAIRAERVPFLKRLRNTLFGSKESNEAAQKREELREQSIQELAQKETATDLEVKYDSGGKQYRVAALVDSSINKDYVAARTMAGLERMGSEEWVKKQRDTGKKYIGFIPKERSQLGDNQWRNLLHHVAVQTTVLDQAGRDLKDLQKLSGEDPSTWTRTRSATILQDDVGLLTVRFDSRSAEKEMLESMPQEVSEEQMPGVDRRMLELTGVATEDELNQYAKRDSWMDVKFQSPRVKLAIIKRIMQLTGYRISDPTISNANTLRDLFKSLRVKETSKKLAQRPKIKEVQKAMPNVKIYPRKRTMIDKEKDVGRWKIIEDELRARHLPVTGKERKWKGAKALST